VWDAKANNNKKFVSAARRKFISKVDVNFFQEF